MLSLLLRKRENLRRYDQPRQAPFHDAPVSAVHHELEAPFRQPNPALAQMSELERLQYFRQLMDQGGLRAPIASEVLPMVDAPVPGEWVLAPDADPDQRLLYFHGGAFTMGSPQSHRLLTSKLSELSGSSVFVPDYRLMPEHGRMASVQDAQQAYRWIIENGPQGPAPARRLVVAGDSAGGNLTLMLLPWARDAGLRAAAAAVALSPAVDTTLSSPSIRRNLDTDVMLRGIMRPIARVPRALLVAGIARKMRINPYDPLISPIFARLHDLPPTLIQASNAETLEDDARRYTNKARLAGSAVTLQIWSSLMHVWQAFEPELPEARAAFAEIGQFLEDASNPSA